MSSRESENPWASIGTDASQLLGRRITEEHPLPIYWAMDHAGVPGLIVRGIELPGAPPRLPRTQGMSIVVTEGGSTDKSELRIFLQSPSDRDVFLKLCLDVVSYSSRSDGPRQATLAIFRRLEHWCALLRKKAPDELSPEEVRGLIGELLVLKQITKCVGIADALSAWIAPDDHPQDFALATALLEVKTRIAGSRQHAHISSLEQLESDDLPIYLHAIELTPSSRPRSFTLNSLACDLMDVAGLASADTLDLAQGLVLKRGYLARSEYDSDRYEIGSRKTYLVSDGFPRIVRSETHRGICQATYVVDMTALAPFECAIAQLPSELRS